MKSYFERLIEEKIKFLKEIPPKFKLASRPNHFLMNWQDLTQYQEILSAAAKTYAISRAFISCRGVSNPILEVLSTKQTSSLSKNECRRDKISE